MEGEALVHVSVLHLEHSQDSRPSSPAQHSSEEPDPTSHQYPSRRIPATQSCSVSQLCPTCFLEGKEA